MNWRTKALVMQLLKADQIPWLTGSVTSCRHSRTEAISERSSPRLGGGTLAGSNTPLSCAFITCYHQWKDLEGVSSAKSQKHAGSWVLLLSSAFGTAKEKAERWPQVVRT